MPTFADTHPVMEERPGLLQGPELGALQLYTSPYLGTVSVVRVIARSYVWGPEQNNYDGTYGYRHYDWSVVEFIPAPGQTAHTLVVNDRDLRDIS